ncbi:MAG: hypothetical protein JRN67_01230 [Nitrososphaerota archaeon]|nr:hypothetical protein [Nitrososphaerota archaeon]
MTDHSQTASPRMLTGNPFVDTGLAVIAVRRQRDSVDQLTLEDLRAIHGNGEWLARDVHSLKSFTMVFTRNSLLTQHRKDDTEMIEKRIKMHGAITTELLNSVGMETKEEFCQSCGNPRSLDLSAAVNRALTPFGEAPRVRFIGRDWFPLAGSLGSDAQSLPAASRDIAMCAKCLFAVQYLPLGVQLYGNELVVFQSTSEELWYSMVREIALEEQRRVASGNMDVIGTKKGKDSLVGTLLQTFNDMRNRKRRAGLDEQTVLYAWRFTNSTSPDLEIEPIPGFALEFLWRASIREGLSQEIETIIRRDKRRSFFSNITAKTEYYGLYPGKFGSEKSYNGASHELFSLYQTEILGRSIRSLKSAFEMARAGIEYQERRDSEHKGKSKAIERLTRKEAFQESDVRNMFKKVMVDAAAKGKFTLQDYLELFPYSEEEGVSVSWSGWKLIRYYLGNIARGNEIRFESGTNHAAAVASSPTYDLVRLIASGIYERYVKERGLDRFKHDIIARAERNKLDASWIRFQYSALATERDGFVYSHYADLCYSEDSRSTFAELLFQCRLLWSEWSNQSSLVDAPNPSSQIVDIEALDALSDLPADVSNVLNLIFSEYVEQRGMDRFEKEVLRRLRTGEISRNWYLNRLSRNPNMKEAKDRMAEYLSYSHESPLTERLFRLQLYLSNLYRIKAISTAAS